MVFDKKVTILIFTDKVSIKYKSVRSRKRGSEYSRFCVHCIVGVGKFGLISNQSIIRPCGSLWDCFYMKSYSIVVQVVCQKANGVFKVFNFKVDSFVRVCEQSDVFQSFFNFLLELLFCVWKNMNKASFSFLSLIFWLILILFR